MLRIASRRRRDNSGRVSRSDRHVLNKQHAPGTLLFRPNVEEKHVSAAGRFAVTGDHGEKTKAADAGVTCGRGGEALEIGKNVLARVNLTIGVDETELQRKDATRRRLIAGAHRFAERRIGREHRRIVAGDRLRFRLAVGSGENRKQYAAGDCNEPCLLHG